MSSLKPMSSILSASSKMATDVRDSDSTSDVMKSSSLPGVATTNSGPVRKRG